jgi:hypothetical protein
MIFSVTDAFRARQRIRQFTPEDLAPEKAAVVTHAIQVVTRCLFRSTRQLRSGPMAQALGATLRTMRGQSLGKSLSELLVITHSESLICHIAFTTPLLFSLKRELPQFGLLAL